MAAKAGTQAPTRIPGKPAPPGDNRRAILEAEEAQLMSFVSRVRKDDEAVEAAKVPFDAAKKARSSTMKLAAAAGFLAREIRELIDDGNVAAEGGRKDLRESEDRRRRFRGWMGLPTGTDPDLFDKMPDSALDEVDWESAGYGAGVRGDEPKPPLECSPAFHPAFMRGYSNGQARNGALIKTLSAPKAAAPAAPKELTPAEKRKAEKAEEARVRESLDNPVKAVTQASAEAGYSIHMLDEPAGQYEVEAPGGVTLDDTYPDTEAAWAAADAHLADNPVEPEVV